MPRTKKAETNGHQPTTDPIGGGSAPASLPITEERNPDMDGEIALAIATRYYGCISEIAPAIAHEFWNRLDREVAAEIILQRPGGSNSKAPKFLSRLEADIAQIDLTTRALSLQQPL